MKTSLHLMLDAQQHAIEKFGRHDYPDGTAANSRRRARAASAKAQTEHERATGSISWMTILREELHEVACEVDPDRLRAELADIAAVALAWSDAIMYRALKNTPPSAVIPIKLEPDKSIIIRHLCWNGEIAKLDLIKNKCAESFGIPVQCLAIHDRRQRVALCRQCAMKLAYEHTRLSQWEVGKAFGNFNHSTVLYACESVDERMQIDANFKLSFEIIETEVLALLSPPSAPAKKACHQ